MSLAAWYPQNGSKTVRVPLVTFWTCVLCLNDRWYRGQDGRPQNTTYFPAVGNPIGNVYCEIGRIIQVNFIGCRPMPDFFATRTRQIGPQTPPLSTPRPCPRTLIVTLSLPGMIRREESCRPACEVSCLLDGFALS